MNEWQEEWREQRDSYGYRHRSTARNAKKPKRPCFVYFMQAEHGGPVMIGWSYSPEARLKAFQKHSPYDLVMRKVVPGTVRLERALHERWEHYRLLGKWFEPQPDMPGCLIAGRMTAHAASWLDEEGAIPALERQADAERIRKREQAREEREAEKRKREPMRPSVAKGFALVGQIGSELLDGQVTAPN
jgi:hypothetical protein